VIFAEGVSLQSLQNKQVACKVFQRKELWARGWPAAGFGCSLFQNQYVAGQGNLLQMDGPVGPARKSDVSGSPSQPLHVQIERGAAGEVRGVGTVDRWGILLGGIERHEEHTQDFRRFG